METSHRRCNKRLQDDLCEIGPSLSAILQEEGDYKGHLQFPMRVQCRHPCLMRACYSGRAWLAKLFTILTVTVSFILYYFSPLPAADRPDPTYEIVRVDYAQLSFKQFMEFRASDRPLIITGIPSKQNPCFSNPSKLSSYLKHCWGDIRVDRMVPGTARRKGCEPVGNLDMQDFWKLFSTPGGLEDRFGEGRYFAQSRHLPGVCPPQIWLKLKYPSYFTGTMPLHRERNLSTWWGYYPLTMYFSQKGMNQTFHVDVPKAELWTAICKGRKKYYVVPRTVAAEKLGWQDMHSWLLRRPANWRLGFPIGTGIIGPGELLYLPAGTMHAVDALEDTVNIVNDFVDVGNLGEPSAVMEKLWRNHHWILGWVNHNAKTFREELEWFADLNRRTQVYDARGIVENSNAVPHGWPSLLQLFEWGLYFLTDPTGKQLSIVVQSMMSLDPKVQVYKYTLTLR